jgi:cytochrome c biogenesis protein CcmG/thiol:disulfide interchange protein DsbE
LSAPLRRPRLLSLLAGGALAIALLPAGPLRAQKMPTLGPLPGNRVGDLALDFTLKDLNNQKHTLKELRGKQVVHVVFWATWCVPCLEEVPALRTIQEKYRDRGVQILGIVIDTNQTKDDVRAAARDMKINYPILWDDGGEVQDRYRVEYIPQNFLIGKDGVIRYTGTSLPSNYEALLEALLKKDDGAARTAHR